VRLNAKTYTAALLLSILAFSLATVIIVVTVIFTSVTTVRVQLGFIVALVLATRRLGVFVRTLVPAAILWKSTMYEWER